MTPPPVPGAVDSHAHLDDPQFDLDRPAVLERAWAAGLAGVLTVGADPGRWDRVLALAEAEPRVRVALGVHPHQATRADAALWARLERLLEHPAVGALGEVGLDFYRDWSPRDVQRQVFRRQLAIARERGLPVVIHSREAFGEVMEGIEAAVAGRVPVVMHCFDGDAAMACRALDAGGLVSFAGPVTFPKNEALREAARAVPAGRLLVETDAPYLSPAPRRGRRNEPAHVAWTLHAVAAARGDDPARLARVVGANAARTFGWAPPGEPPAPAVDLGPPEHRP